MKKPLLLLAFVALSCGKLSAEENIWLNLGSLKALVPFAEVKVSYLFDGIGKQSLVGAETPLFQFKRLQLTGGAVTTLTKEGSPYLGLHFSIPNPASNFVPLAGIQPGVFGGRNFNDGEWMLGFKASASIF